VQRVAWSLTPGRITPEGVASFVERSGYLAAPGYLDSSAMFVDRIVLSFRGAGLERANTCLRKGQRLRKSCSHVFRPLCSSDLPVNLPTDPETKRVKKPPLAERESIWSYPRPPRVEPNTRHLRVVHNQVTIAETRRGYRVLEYSHPPSYYIPLDDIDLQYVMVSSKVRSTFCEFKGEATYYDVEVGWEVSEGAAWSYDFPTRAYRMLKDHIAFYPAKVDACWVDEYRVRPEPRSFYGGWVTPLVKGVYPEEDVEDDEDSSGGDGKDSATQ